MSAVCTCPPDKDWDGENCQEPWPAVGATIRLLNDIVTRAPGDDGMTEIRVSKGAEGVVEGFVREWFHIDVRLYDGRNVWVCPDDMELVHGPTTTAEDN